ncbi:hypothetical protein [Ileibacterium valens]|uniref:hypothetical protein n=1 Tax=Ileibacterium valens TaxID=1862668 RepID=UPI0025701A5D|nr:hypothetical protein [Ileibacterium valens]
MFLNQINENLNRMEKEKDYEGMTISEFISYSAILDDQDDCLDQDIAERLMSLGVNEYAAAAIDSFAKRFPTTKVNCWTADIWRQGFAIV